MQSANKYAEPMTDATENHSHSKPRLQALCYNQALKRSEPTVVVVRTVVRLTSSRTRLEFLGERHCPRLPAEVPLP
jgi:hypothetical protein